MHPLEWVIIVVLVVSFLSNVTPFVGASYTLLATLSLTLVGFTPVNFLVVVLSSAVGATLAKIVIYFGAFGFRDILVKNKNVRLIGRFSNSGAFYLALFVTSLLPVFPFDDFIYIGAGATSSSLGLMSAVSLVAKIAKSGVEIALEYTILRDMSQFFGLHSVELTLVLSLLFIGIGVAVYKVDWEGAYLRLRGRSLPAETSTPTHSGS